MLPGKRCSAGRSRNTRSSRSGSMRAIFVASRSPSRFLSSYGPLKAFSIFTCWSSTIPMSSASGSVSRACWPLRCRSRRSASRLLLRPLLHELKPEPALHAEVAGRDARVERRSHLDDRVVLHVQLQHAADAAVRAHGLGHRLPPLVPRPRAPHVVLALEHQGARRAHADAVPAVDTGRIRERRLELGRDVSVEAAARYAQRKRVLCVDAASLHALVAEDAARVVAHVELVVDLDRLLDGGRRRTEAVGLDTVALHPSMHLGRRERHVHGGREHLQHDAAALAHALGVGEDLHAALDLARARGDEHARPFDLDHAHAAHVHRRERLEVAERRRVDAQAAAGLEDGRALGDVDLLAVDVNREHSLRQADEGCSGHQLPPRSGIADWIALAAVWPRPQIDASRIACATSASSVMSAAVPFWPRAPRIRPRISSCRFVPTRHGTHWPHDSWPKKLAMRMSIAPRSAVSSSTITAPEPSVAPIARVPSKLSGTSRLASVTNDPAAPPSSTACSVRPSGRPPARSISARSGVPIGTSYTPGLLTCPDTQNSRVPADSGVPVAPKAAAPPVRISSTFINVSTLLTSVGLPKRPACTGKGGLLRGSPRLPSIELKSAVSSPQMYAPAPRRTSMSKRAPVPATSSPSRPCSRASPTACSIRRRASGYSPRT